MWWSSDFGVSVVILDGKVAQQLEKVAWLALGNVLVANVHHHLVQLSSEALLHQRAGNLVGVLHQSVRGLFVMGGISIGEAASVPRRRHVLHQEPSLPTASSASSRATSSLHSTSIARSIALLDLHVRRAAELHRTSHQRTLFESTIAA